jgi:hypothetical protein
VALTRSAPVPLPRARGTLSCHAVNVLLGNRPGGPIAFGPEPDTDPLDEDLQLALYLCAERRRFQAATGTETDLDRWAARLEAALEGRLCRLVPRPAATPADPVAGLAEVQRLVDAGNPSPAAAAAGHGPRADRELAHHRSLPPASPAVELGVDPGTLLDRLPSETLAVANVPLLLRHPRWRGALGGYRAATELLAAGRVVDDAAWLQRLGVPPGPGGADPLTLAADRRHLAGELVAKVLDWEPELVGDVLWGAAVAGGGDAGFGALLTACWGDGRSSLRPLRPLRAPA